jgi:2-polyprenyl-6-methoxyphenol hydroxylase-like FAD-dependent oxidoreductase
MDEGLHGESSEAGRRLFTKFHLGPRCDRSDPCSDAPDPQLGTEIDRFSAPFRDSGTNRAPSIQVLLLGLAMTDRIETDVVIVGGGLAGATTAAMLGRAGVPAVLIDPHLLYPPDFRCEKLDASQVQLLRKTGLAEPVLAHATPDRHVWIARYGRVIERRPNGQYDILYGPLVNTMRAQIPAAVERIVEKADTIATGPERQHVMLSNGRAVSARLIVLATGLNNGLRSALGIVREDVSLCHSISIGFDIEPAGPAPFPFRALTYYPRRPGDRMAYMTLFPVGASMRVNLFVYRDTRDPWLRALRERPEATLDALMPRLRRIAGAYRVAGEIKLRPVDLYVTHNAIQPGLALVGDAFGTSCPAAGTGVNKVLTDVERLCNRYIPAWLASPSMGADKIAAFYADPQKRACDAESFAKAFALRQLSTGEGLPWRARRAIRAAGQLGRGMLRALGETRGRRAPARAGTAPAPP